MILLLAIIVLLFKVQYNLVGRSKKWGFLLPSLSFIGSILACIWFLVFGGIGTQYIIHTVDAKTHTFQTMEEADAFLETIDEKTVTSFEKVNAQQAQDTGKIAGGVFTLFISINGITLGFVIINFCRRMWPKAPLTT